MSGFVEGFAIEALFAGSRMMAGGLRAFFEQDAVGRLLILIQAQFGEQAGLSRRDVLAWRSDAAVEGGLRAALVGEAPDEAFTEELTSAIEVALASADAVPTEGRRDLAERVAGFVFAAVPYAAEGGSQAHALVLSRLEQGQQSILDAVSDAQDDAAPDLARALVIGPLRYAGGVEDVAEAERRAAAGDDAGAAGLLLSVAQRLDELGVAFAAETLRERAAAHLAVAGSVEAAAETLLAVAEGRLERGASAWAERSIETLRDLLSDDLAPLADAVSARGSWPDDIDSALARLEAGFAAACSAYRDDVERWNAHHVELLTFVERWQEAVDAAGVLADAECDDGARLQIVMDVLESREVLSGPEPIEARWLDVLRWADTEATPRSRAVVWQRRGLALARREQVAGAFDAYRRATAAWAEVPGHEEQAADSFFSMQAVALMTARQPPEMELRPVAWTVRGSSNAPVAVADRLEREAMDKRLTGRLPDAQSGYLHALLIHRRVGSLQGLLQDFERLGELYAHAGEHGLALTCFVRAGQAGKASQAASHISGQEVAARLSVTGPRWERTAAMHAIADVGRTLPEAFVAEIVDELLAQAADEPDGWVAPQPAPTARRALAAVALAAPPESRPAVFDALTGQLAAGLPDQRSAAMQALTLATRAGLTDARAALTEHYIEDPYNSRVSSLWLGEQARTHASVRGPLLAAAVDGDAAILEPLAIADLIGPTLQEQVDAATTRAADVVTIERREENGQVTVSVGMGIRLEGPAIVARAASPDPRAALTARMVEILTSTEEPELNRSSAAGALFNLASAMDLEEARSVAEAMAPLALGDYEPSQFDMDNSHPLSRFKISLSQANQLRVSAIGTLAQIMANHEELDRAPLLAAVRAALRTGSGPVVAAAFDATARLGDTAFDLDPEDGFSHPDPRVRVSALVAWAGRREGLPGSEDVDALARDPDTNVRLQLCAMAGHAGEAGRALLDRMVADPDAFVRAKAAQWLRGEGFEAD